MADPGSEPAELPLLGGPGRVPDRMAVNAPDGLFTYRDLGTASGAVAGALLAHGPRDPDGPPGPAADLAEARVAFLVSPSFAWTATAWGIWRAGGIAVPLAVSHPPAELAYVLDDTDPVAVVVHPELADRVQEVADARGVPVLTTRDVVPRPDEERGGDGAAPRPALPRIAEDRAALILYTSGTTGRPKGVVHTHRSLRAQVESLTGAWGWTADDHILLTLPLHHVHGIVNVVLSALHSGACCSILPAFDAGAVWTRFARGDLTLYMAVPTIYGRLLDAWEGADPPTRERWSEGARRLRLMVSGSAALPVSTLERWEEVTGHRLLERYGMTEIGMGLSNPLEGPRVPGHVGRPLPGVEVVLADEAGRAVPREEPGEVLVRGPGVFREYWRRPRETREAFTGDGRFRTGDVAVLDGDAGYRMLGRTSVDILKTGGEKVSALEVEETLREHPAVADCAVVGVTDPAWGERVCVAVEAREGADAGALAEDPFRGWAKTRLAPYKVPRTVRVVEALPRNAMGKVDKPAVKTLFT